MTHEPDDDRDETASPEELAEAEALARALDGEAQAAAPPDDALGAAMLVRWSEGGGSLSDARHRAIRDELLARPAESVRRGVVLRFPRRAVPIAVATLAAAAAVTLVLLVGQENAESPVATTLPLPDPALVRAQLRAASNEEGADAELATEMRAFRGQLFAALEERYER